MKNRDNNEGVDLGTVLVIAVMWIGLAACLFAVACATGCSSVRQIGNAAREVQARAASASGHLESAVATGDVGDKAMPHVEAAKTDVDAIGASATEIAEVVASGAIKDTEGWLTRLLKSAGFIIALVAFIVASVLYAPVLRPILNHIGAWLNIIPKPIKVDAESDAELIAMNESGKVKATVKQVAAIQEKKRDPRYRKKLDEGLIARGVAT